MKPQMTNMNLALGRIEEIDRRMRSLSGIDEESQKQKSTRFADVLAEVQKNDAKIPGKSKVETTQQVPQPKPGNVRAPGSNVSSNKTEYEKYITKYAKEYKVDENLVRAVIKAESAFNPKALSPKGAMGLMQLMPGTAKALGVDDAWDPEQNIRGGVKYLAQLSDKFNGDVEKILAGYNAGPHRVVQYGGVPPYAETQAYVKKIVGWLKNGK